MNILKNQSYRIVKNHVCSEIQIKNLLWGGGFKSLECRKFNNEIIDLGSFELFGKWEKLLYCGKLSDELD